MNAIDQAFGQNWALYLGDSGITVQGIPDNSVDLSVYSPPLAAWRSVLAGKVPRHSSR